jgi:hypothetical protein
MAKPTLLYGVGATKAGTSWLYRLLDDHPECHVRAVKEAHYWNSETPEQRQRRVEVLTRQLQGLEHDRQAAVARGNGQKAANLDRRIAAIAGLIDVMRGDVADHRAYVNWLSAGCGKAQRLIGDVTPAYGLLSTERLREMLAVWKGPVRVVYLIRDPLERLWSHVRMDAERRMQAGDDFAAKAHGIFDRLLARTGEMQIWRRGDYRAAIRKLTEAVPAGGLMIGFTEQMFSGEGRARIYDFLGITAGADDVAEDRLVHPSRGLDLDDARAERAVNMLKVQYNWVAENVGTLPAVWQANLARASA